MSKELLVNKPYTHRGYHNGIEIIENSLEAFQESNKRGFPIELDIQLTSDHKVVVYHDYNLARLTGENKKVSEVKLSEIKQLHLSNKRSLIPTLEEVLDLINGKVTLLIEIKNESKVGVLEQKLMEILNNYKGRYAIQSFNPFSIYWIKKRFPNVLVGQLSSNFKNSNLSIIKKLVLKKMLLNFLIKPDFISYNIDSLPNRRVKKFRDQGIPVLSWTIRTQEQLIKAKKFSDNFIFENLLIK